MSVPAFQIGKAPMPLAHHEDSVATPDQSRSGIGTIPPYTSTGLSWAYDSPHIVRTAGFGRSEALIEPINFAEARYLGVHYDMTNGKKDVERPQLVVQTKEHGTFLLDKRQQHRSPGDPMALRQPFGISAQLILLMDPNDLSAYRSLGGYVDRFLSNNELRELDPVIRGKSDAAFYYQRITADAVLAEERRRDKQAEQ